jgi:hypothetical protein
VVDEFSGRRPPAAGGRSSGGDEEQEGHERDEQRERQGARQISDPSQRSRRARRGHVDVQEGQAREVGEREGDQGDGHGEVEDRAPRGRHPVDEVEDGLEDVGAPDRHADGELGGGREVARETSRHPGRRRS